MQHSVFVFLPENIPYCRHSFYYSEVLIYTKPESFTHNESCNDLSVSNYHYSLYIPHPLVIIYTTPTIHYIYHTHYSLYR